MLDWLGALPAGAATEPCRRIDRPDVTVVTSDIFLPAPSELAVSDVRVGVALAATDVHDHVPCMIFTSTTTRSAMRRRPAMLMRIARSVTQRLDAAVTPRPPAGGTSHTGTAQRSMNGARST